MKQIKYILLMTLCVLGIASCQDDWMESMSEGADINKPVRTTLKFGVPRSTEIAVTKANNDLSDVYSVRIYIFSGDKFMSAQTIANGDLNPGTTGENGHTYTANNVTLYTGTQTVYALGNLTMSGYFDTGEPRDLIGRLDAAAEQGKDAFLAVLYNLQTATYEGHTFPNLTAQYAPLSGVGDITVQSNGSSSGTIRLKRILSQIKFKINTTYTKLVDHEQHDITFTPQTYTFYNMPKKAYIMGGDEQEPVTGADNFYTTSSDPIPVEAEFEVYVPENIQKAKTDCGDKYENREAFNGEGSNKTWSYAPDYGTYVVLQGRYAETKHSDNSLVKYADVEYTVHLGDFSGETGNLSNFSVERNNIYTYTITVQGVDKIVAEAKKEGLSDDYQNSAEGNVIELTTGSKVFNLDAHYEQLYVSYNLSDIARGIELDAGATDDEIKQRVADNFLLSIHTPFNTRATTEEVIKPYNNELDEEQGMEGVDDEWIKFYSLRSDAPQLMSYAETSDQTLLSPWKVCQLMGEAVFELYKSMKEGGPVSAPTVAGLNVTQEENDYVARFTIFINEYFYQKDLNDRPVAWDSYTNQEARTMLIASDMQTSTDMNSTYSTALTYISQASIQTFYNADAAGYYNAMGLESYNENGKIVGFGVSRAPSGYEYDWGKGRANTLVNIAGREDINSTNTQWSDYVNWNQVGYTDDNTASKNRIADLPTQNAAYYACLSRNRDLNRNGRIDDNEVRWYLPALSQYLRIGIGTEALSADARLYTGLKGNMSAGGYPRDYVDDGALYFVSNEDKNYYWAVEMGAYGSFDDFRDDGGQIRCVRNLPNLAMVEQAGDNEVSVGKDAWAGPVYGALTHIETGRNESNYVFSFGDRLIPTVFRSQIQTGPYSTHNETQAANHLPSAFVVAQYYMGEWERQGSGWWAEEVWVPKSYSGNDVYNPWTDPCRNYDRENNGDNTYWRTPNLSELMVMTTEAAAIGMSRNTLCSTRFSNQNVRIGFYYQVGSNNMITAGGHNQIPNGYIRCVRDASPEEIEEANRNMPSLEESVGN